MRYPEVEQYIKKNENAIFHANENYELEMDYLSEIDEELYNELGDSITYKNKLAKYKENYLYPLN